MAAAVMEGAMILIVPTQNFDVRPNRTKQCNQLLEGATGVFGNGPKAEPKKEIDVNILPVKSMSWY